MQAIFVAVSAFYTLLYGLGLLLGGLGLVATLLPLLRQTAWWVRIFDFPRLQIVVDKSHLKLQDSELANPVKKFGKLVQRGDFIRMCSLAPMFVTNMV